jgi:Grap2 and cyclin-D-interacting
VNSLKLNKVAILERRQSQKFGPAFDLKRERESHVRNPNMPMSSSESSPDLVQRLLTLLLSTSTDAIAHLHSKPDSSISPLSALRTDFLSLLSVLYSNTTKLSIALNPSSPVYSAAVTPLNDLITHSSTLASNASLFLPDVHGRALTSEVHSTAKGVLTALQELAHAHISLLAKPTTTKHKIDTSRSSGNDDYLAKTGIVHELIRQAKAEQPHGLSKTNLIAVQKRWREHSEIIADAVSTLEADASLPEGDEEEDELDDGWDDPELDLPEAGKQSPEQIQLAKKVRTSSLTILSGLPNRGPPPLPPLDLDRRSTHLDALRRCSQRPLGLLSPDAATTTKCLTGRSARFGCTARSCDGQPSHPGLWHRGGKSVSPERSA